MWLLIMLLIAMLLTCALFFLDWVSWLSVKKKVNSYLWINFQYYSFTNSISMFIFINFFLLFAFIYFVVVFPIFKWLNIYIYIYLSG